MRIAFDQTEKEVQDLHQRTKEGIQTARLNGKQIGQKKGDKFNVKKAAPAKILVFICVVNHKSVSAHTFG